MNVDTQLSKKELIELKHEQERKERESKARKGYITKWIIIVLVVALLGAGGAYGIKELSKPLPGLQFPNQGRDHVKEEEWSKFAYNSNPPTSGPHDSVWTTAGVYDIVPGDGHLVHSLEHGYIIISYNCNNGQPLSQQDCDALKKQLSDLANAKRLWKLVVVPRPTLDSRIALSAWTYLEKLDGFDKDKIATFIDAHRDHGPEQTME